MPVNASMAAVLQQSFQRLGHLSTGKDFYGIFDQLTGFADDT